MISESKNKKRILIIDDDEAILDVVQTILESEGFEVETAQRGEEILTRTTDFPDLILLDVLLSGEDGIETCRKLKSRFETKDIPIIMLSAHSNIAQTARTCADNYLPKPFDIDVLTAVVKKHLK